MSLPNPARLQCLMSAAVLVVAMGPVGVALPNAAAQTLDVEARFYPQSAEPGEMVPLTIFPYNAWQPLQISIDLTPLGGPSHMVLRRVDDLCGWDYHAAWPRACVQIPPDATGGTKSLRVTVVDARGYRGSADAVLGVALANDTDADGLPDKWETRYGFSRYNASGHDGPWGDPDGDGVSNLEEYRGGTHPNARFRKYLAEGATGPLFDTAIAIFNPHRRNAKATLQFMRMQGPPVARTVDVPSLARLTIDPELVPGLDNTGFSTLVESDGDLVVDRTMTWDQGALGSHAETAVNAPAMLWYLAEGATHSGFDLYYLVQNPGGTDAVVEVTYLLPRGAPPVVRQYTAPARTRTNIHVDAEPELSHTDVSAVIRSLNGVRILVERAMYKSRPDEFFSAGHASAGVTETAPEWFLAEGATGPYFDLYVLLANPGDTAAVVDVDYLLPNGTVISKTYDVAERSRRTIHVDAEDALLANTGVSTTVRARNGHGIIVERAMWWPGPGPDDWREAHCAAGSRATSRLWALADGEVGGPQSTDTYLLIANTSPRAGAARVSLFSNAPALFAQRTIALPALSRTTLEVGATFPEARGARFGTLVESAPAFGEEPADLVVERAMYGTDGRSNEGWLAGWPYWPAGTNALGVPVTRENCGMQWTGEAGEWVSGGLPGCLTDADGLFRLRNLWRGIEVLFEPNDRSSNWTIWLEPPDGETLAPGVYEGAVSVPHSGPAPGIRVSGESRTCDSHGSFTIRELRYGTNGAPERVVVDFVQYCEGNPAALRGSASVGPP